MRSVFPAPPLVAFRRDHNLCDTFVHGKTNKLLKTDAEEYDCCFQTYGIMHREPQHDTDLQCTYQVVSVARGMWPMLLPATNADEWCMLARRRDRSGKE